MNLAQLYSKIAIANHSKIIISEDTVLYLDTSEVRRMMIKGGEVIPLDQDTRTWLEAL